jgi:hypothetical protein
VSDPGKVIRFPVQLRVVPLSDPPIATSPADEPTILLVAHDGRLYALHALLAQLPAAYRLELQDAGPRSGQEAWDLVTRRWPALAACIAAGIKSADAEMTGWL